MVAFALSPALVWLGRYASINAPTKNLEIQCFVGAIPPWLPLFNGVGTGALPLHICTYDSDALYLEINSIICLSLD